MTSKDLKKILCKLVPCYLVIIWPFEGFVDQTLIEYEEHDRLTLKRPNNWVFLATWWF